MEFKINKLKFFLSSIKKYKVNTVKIKSDQFNLIINITKNQPKKASQNTVNKNFLKQENNKYNKIEQIDSNNKLNNENNKYYTIVSPMIGTFYRSPAPNETSFVELYQTVKLNQTVCIIEAMKLMNEIKSEVNGKIMEILVKDGDVVDCGQALMKVQKL